MSFFIQNFCNIRVSLPVNRRFHHFVGNIGVAFYFQECRCIRKTSVRQLTFSLIEVFNGLIDLLTFFSVENLFFLPVYFGKCCFGSDVQDTK